LAALVQGNEREKDDEKRRKMEEEQKV